MKTFYDFLLEAPQSPAVPANTPGGSPTPASSPTPPAGGPPGGLGGPLGGPSSPSPLGGPSAGGLPSLGSSDLSSGGSPASPSAGPVPIQKLKSLTVWDALEKLIKNKNGQSDSNMIKS